MRERLQLWLARLTERVARGETNPLDRQLRLYIGFVFALFIPATLIFAALDWVRGERATAVLVGLICLALLATIPVLARARDVRVGYRVVFSLVGVLLPSVLWIGGGGGYAALWYFAFPPGLYYVFGSREGTAWVVFYLIPAWIILQTSAGAEYPLDLASRFVAVYALSSALALGLQRARAVYEDELRREKADLQEALAKVRTLSEMLPMCAWCGKVRDDEGYWTRIEEYLRNQTGTQVSHGVCESCAARLEAGLDTPGAGSGTRR